eukprot:1187704-Amphidinium_carterae.1
MSFFNLHNAIIRFQYSSSTLGPWFEATVKEAKKMHYKYVTSAPSEQCDIEKMYVLGRSAPIPRPEHALESQSLARCEILDALPEWLTRQVNKAGMHRWFVLKILQPSPDFLRIGFERSDDKGTGYQDLCKGR